MSYGSGKPKRSDVLSLGTLKKLPYKLMVIALLNTISVYGKFHRKTLFSDSGETCTCIISNEKKKHL